MERRKLAVACIGMASFVLFKRKKKRRLWSKNWLALREVYSDMKLLRELRANEPDDFKNYLRMDPDTFDDLLKLVKPYLQKEDTQMRCSIPPEERLVATLRFLATGRSYECLKFSTGISPQSMGRIVPETCKVIYEVLRKEYLRFPNTPQEWKKIVQRFDSRWQFPNCGGAIDGKHIRISCPANSGSLYYNYKKFYSIVLLGIVNADYEFVYIDVGIFDYTSFYNRLMNGQLHLPDQSDNVNNLNFVFVGDEGFRLYDHILKPFNQVELTYTKRIFNYRLSRARNVVENAFGIISSRFRILHTPINIKPENTQFVVMAICVLHNFLCRRSKSYLNQRTGDLEDKKTHDLRKDGEWRNECFELVGMENIRQSNSKLDGKVNREEYVKYFNGKGSVPWQHEMLQMGRA